MRGENLPTTAIVQAETHPTPFPLVWPFTYLGEVPWAVGTAYFVCASLSVVLGNLKAGLVWLAVWWLSARVFRIDYHFPTAILRWLQTSAWDMNKARNQGASVAPLSLKPRVPLGIYR